MAISSLQAMPGGNVSPNVVPLTRAQQLPQPAATVLFGDQFTPSKSENITDDPGVLNFGVPVTSQSVSGLINGLKQIAKMKEQTGGTIKLLINTPGGDAYAGMQAANYMKGSRVPIDTVVLGGQAASMGSLLFLMGTGRRVMTTDSTLMFHQPRMVLNTMLTATEMANMGDNALRLKNQMDKLIAKVTELPLDEVAEMTKKDTFVYPLEALKKGFATHVLSNDDLGQAFTPDAIKGLSDAEIERRDREHDYDGLKTEVFDAKISDPSLVQAGRRPGLGGRPVAIPLEALFGPGGDGAPGFSAEKPEEKSARPRMILMA